MVECSQFCPHSLDDKAIGLRLWDEGDSTLLLDTVTTVKVLHTETMGPSHSAHTLMIGRGYDICELPSSYAGYADHHGPNFSHQHPDNLPTLERVRISSGGAPSSPSRSAPSDWQSMSAVNTTRVLLYNREEDANLVLRMDYRQLFTLHAVVAVG